PASRWWLYDLSGGRRMLWEGHQTLEGIAEGTHAHVSLPLTRLEQLAWSPDGKKVAGVAHVARETQLWTLDADGTHAQAVLSDASLSFPSWSPDGSLAYLASRGNRQTISLPCGKGSTPPSAPEA
ncbi:MAG: LpqB family beta-propeller domain-containing protein, partial [Bryobacteraceae bacterium]